MDMNWLRSDDFFNNLTDGNYLLSKKIFDSYDLKLHSGIADPAVQTLYTDNHIICSSFNAAYSVWDVLRSTNKGLTHEAALMLDQLMSTKAKAWDTAIQQVYPQDTSSYISLMPNRRASFQTGTGLSRVLAVENLVAAIGSDISLAAVKTSVQSFLTQILAARTKHQNQWVAIEKALFALEITRKSAGSSMLLGFATLLGIHYLNPKEIDVFFPIEYLTRKIQFSYERTLVDQSPAVLFKRKMDTEKQTIDTINSSDFIVRIYFTNGLTDKLVHGELFIDLLPNSTGSHNPLLMNYSDDRRHCYVMNMGTGTAHVEVNI